ncbi:MAG: hypothetical protein CL946_00065 [Ectothiorhodospiraceae bacterium]|nr:hypothetical protein [Ectothiorhodospiraceae bacterium]
MADIQKAQATQIKNIEERTGKTMKQLIALVRESGIEKHGGIVKMLKTDLEIGHGDANLIAHLAKQADSPSDDKPEDPLDALYAGPKGDLRPIHDALLKHLNRFGTFEAAPKKKYISYRRKKQFAMIGPATNTRVEVGLNIKELPSSPRLEEQGPNKMCNYLVKLTEAKQVDKELIAWIKAAYDAAGDA